jgi:hypothetical protein
MIATSRKSAYSPIISRRFELSRLQDQLIALAYQALIPVISYPLERPRRRLGHNQSTAVQGVQSKARGA